VPEAPAGRFVKGDGEAEDVASWLVREDLVAPPGAHHPDSWGFGGGPRLDALIDP